MKSPADDWGGIPVADPAPASPAKDDWGGVSVPESTGPKDDWGGVQQQAHPDDIQKLIADPHFSPADYAAQTGDTETAFQARQALKNRTFGEKASAFGSTLADPETYANAAKGVGKFALGLAATPIHTIAQAGATVGAPIAGALGATDLQKTLVNEQQTQGAEATLAAQQIEQGVKNTGHAISGLFPNAGNAVGDAPDIAGSEPRSDEAIERERFNDEIQAAKNAQQLAQGRPLETGVVAAASKAATGQENLSDIYSPEALAENNARPVSPLITESMSAAADPTNLAIPLAGEVPGVKTLAGGLVQGAGKAASAIGTGLGYAAKAQRAFHIPILTALTHGVGAGLEAQAAKLGTQLGSNAFGWAGEALDAQGGALRTGIPSALDQTAQSALTAGESALGTNAQRFVGNAASNIVSTALGFAPVNAVLSDGDPRKFAESEVGAGAMGGAFGLAGDRARLEQTAAYRLAQYGSQQFTENPMFDAHQQTMQRFTPEDQQAINTLRGFLYGGTGTDVLVLDGQNFAKQVGAIGGNARGQFAPSPDGSTIYVNADAVKGGAGSVLDTAGHETGHAVVDFLKNAGREGDAQNLFSSISGALTPEQTQALTDTYHAKLLASTDLTGKTPQEVNDIKQKIAADNPPEKIVEENLAEITRRILSGKNIASFALPQPVLERVMDSASRFLESKGMMPEIDPNASLAFKAQMVREAARRLNSILYETGKTASASANEGPTVTQQLIEAKNQLAALPEVTPNMPFAKAQAIARQRAAAEKQIDEIQGITGETPTPASATPQPSTATAPESNPLNRFRIAAILRQQGLNQAEAKQWADAAEGSTDEEAVVDALKKRANAKFPTVTPTAAAPVTQPVAPKSVQPEPIAKPDEGSLPTPPKDEPLPASGGGVQPSVGSKTATAEPVAIPKTDVARTETEAPVVHTKEDLDAIAAKSRTDFLADKALAKAGKNKGQHTAKNQELADKAAFDAAAQAHAETVPPNYGGMKQRVDAFGKKTVSGNLDPSRPFDSWLIDQAQKAGNLPKEALDTMLRLQDAIGKTVTFDYGHAPVEEAGEQPTQESRAAQQAKHSVKDRLSGESPMQVEAKTSIPLGVQFNSGNKSFNIFGASPEKLLNNFNHIKDAYDVAGVKFPYKDINDPQFVADFKGVIRNHQNGWFGDGSRPAVGTAEYPDTANPDWANSPERAVIPQDRFDFINMMLGDEGAKASTPQAKAKAHLANENRTLVNEAGETNETRQKINDAIGPVEDKRGQPSTWSKVTLEDPLNENLSPALASNVRDAIQTDESIRQHGKVGDLGRFFEGGKTPNRAKSAAGFLPNEEDTEGWGNGTVQNNGSALFMRYPTRWEFLQNNHPASMRGENFRYEDGVIKWNEGVPSDPEVRWAAETAVGRKGLFVEKHGDMTGQNKISAGFMPRDFEQDDTVRMGQEEAGLRDHIAKVRSANGFLPNGGTPASEEPEDPSAAATPENRGGNPLQASASQQDSGTPEDGKTPSDRLAREAEAAGVVLSIDSLKGLIKNDPATMQKIRARIEQNTGKPSRYLPDDTEAPEDGGTPQEKLMREAEQAGVSVSLDTLKGLLRGDNKALAKVRVMIRDKTGNDAEFMPSDEVESLLNSAEKKNSLGESRIKPEDLGLPFEHWQAPQGNDEETKEIPVSDLRLGRDELVKSRLLAANRIFKSEPFRDAGVSQVHVVPSQENGKYVVAENGNHRAAILMLTHPNSRIRVTVTR